MTTQEDVLNYISNADKEELQILASAIRSQGTRERIQISKILKDDINRLAQVLPHTTSEYNGTRFAKTSAYYITVLRDLTDLVLQYYTVKKSERGYPMWTGHETIAQAKVDDYKCVFHELTNTLLDLMEQYGSNY